MPQAFIRKMEIFAPLSPDDRAYLVELSTQTREVKSDQDLIREGERPENVILILEGFAARYKILPDGNRQIFAYLIAGDFCDLHVALLDEMDHSIATVSPCRVASIPRSIVTEITEHRPALARAFWWCSLVDEATLREWVTNLGQRPAEQRIAHLFCELHARMAAVGLTRDGTCTLPLTQVEIGDTMGLSVVHTNRSLKTLRDEELVVLKGQQLHIPDIERLKAYADFNPNYLHLTRRRPDPQVSG